MAGQAGHWWRDGAAVTGGGSGNGRGRRFLVRELTLRARGKRAVRRAGGGMRTCVGRAGATRHAHERRANVRWGAKRRGHRVPRTGGEAGGVAGTRGGSLARSRESGTRPEVEDAPDDWGRLGIEKEREEIEQAGPRWRVGLLMACCLMLATLCCEMTSRKKKEERRKKKEKGRKDFSDFERRTTH